MIVQIYKTSAKLASLKSPKRKILHILKQLLQILKVTLCFLHILKLRLHILKLPLASFCLITSPAPLSSNLPMKWGKNAYPPKFLNGVSVDEICEVNCR